MRQVIWSIIWILVVSNFGVAAEKILTYETTTGKQKATKDSPSGTVVGTTDTQTLTNKTLTTPIIQGANANGAQKAADFVNRPAAGASTDEVYISFGLKTQAGLDTESGRIRSLTENPSAYDSALAFSVMSGGVLSERMRIKSDGKVGIGVTPSYKLHVTGADERILYLSKTASGVPIAVFEGGYIEVGASGLSYGIRGATGASFALGANGQDYVNINTSGYVNVTQRLGINQASPSYKIHITGGDETVLYASKTASGTPIASFANGDVVITGGYGLMNPNAEVLRLGTSNTARVNIDASGHFLPVTDNAYDNGNATYRWRLVRGVTVTQGDLGFTETTCPACNKPFLVGEDLVLRVIGYDFEGGTRTIPVHLKCKGMPMTVKTRETEIKYVFQDGEVKQVQIPKKVRRLKEISAIKSGYKLEEATGNFIRIQDKKVVERLEAVEIKSQEIEEEIFKTITIQ